MRPDDNVTAVVTPRADVGAWAMVMRQTATRRRPQSLGPHLRRALIAPRARRAGQCRLFLGPRLANLFSVVLQSGAVSSYSLPSRTNEEATCLISRRRRAPTISAVPQLGFQSGLDDIRKPKDLCAASKPTRVVLQTRGCTLISQLSAILNCAKHTWKVLINDQDSWQAWVCEAAFNSNSASTIAKLDALQLFQLPSTYRERPARIVLGSHTRIARTARASQQFCGRKRNSLPAPVSSPEEAGSV
ncbi:hypothetical protein ABH995_000784 [Bradyrhizobium yuanmingense]